MPGPNTVDHLNRTEHKSDKKNVAHQETDFQCWFSVFHEKTRYLLFLEHFMHKYFIHMPPSLDRSVCYMQ